MAKVIIGFSKSKKPFPILSKLIILFDRFIYGRKSDISHAYFKFKAISWERDLYYQASGHATNFMGDSHFLSLHAPQEEYELDLPSDVVSMLGQICIDREGKPYGMWQNVGTFLVFAIYMLTFKNILITNPFKSGTNCVEEVGRVLILSGLDLPMPSFDMDTTSPKPFRDWVVKFPMAKRVK